MTKKNSFPSGFSKTERHVPNQRFRTVLGEGNSKGIRQLGATASQSAQVKSPRKSKTAVAGRSLNSPLPMSKIKRTCLQAAIPPGRKPGTK